MSVVGPDHVCLQTWLPCYSIMLSPPLASGGLCVMNVNILYVRLSQGFTNIVTAVRMTLSPVSVLEIEIQNNSKFSCQWLWRTMWSCWRGMTGSCLNIFTYKSHPHIHSHINWMGSYQTCLECTAWLAYQVGFRLLKVIQPMTSCWELSVMFKGAIRWCLLRESVLP